MSKGGLNGEMKRPLKKEYGIIQSSWSSVFLPMFWEKFSCFEAYDFLEMTDQSKLSGELNEVSCFLWGLLALNWQIAYFWWNDELKVVERAAISAILWY
jgi:hypothetical protein